MFTIEKQRSMNNLVTFVTDARVPIEHALHEQSYHLGSIDGKLSFDMVRARKDSCEGPTRLLSHQIT